MCLKATIIFPPRFVSHNCTWAVEAIGKPRLPTVFSNVQRKNKNKLIFGQERDKNAEGCFRKNYSFRKSMMDDFAGAAESPEGQKVARVNNTVMHN